MLRRKVRFVRSFDHVQITSGLGINRNVVRVFRVLAVLSSLTLLALYISYRSNTKAAEELRRTTAMPSSKIGTAVEIYQVDWDGVYPHAGPSPQEFETDYFLNAPGSKSTRVFAPDPTTSPTLEELTESP